MQVRFKFDYNCYLTSAEVDQLHKIITPSNIKLDTEREHPVIPGAFRVDNWTETFVGELHEMYLIKSDLSISVVGIAASATFNSLMTKMDVLERAVTGASKQLFNQKCEVHVPGLGLLNVNETKVVEDYCTHALQNELDDGWRILAICPQPDQRRPDYVLGRTKHA